MENIPINKPLLPAQPDRTSIILTTFDTHEMDHFALQTILRTFYNYKILCFSVLFCRKNIYVIL